jgi:AcrR family transcriptional regulator
VPLVVPSTKEQIVLAAERLFARHGVDGVSLRQIGAAAGTSNNSAVQYHFGSKDGLVEAIFGYRLPRLRERRALLVAERRPRDLHGWAECVLLPVMEQGELPDSHYLGFITMLHQHGRRDILQAPPGNVPEPARACYDQLAGFLPHLPHQLRAHRISQAMALTVRAGADREIAHARDLPTLDFAVEATDLIDAATGFLQAPVSAQALTALEQAAAAGPALAPFL